MSQQSNVFFRQPTNGRHSLGGGLRAIGICMCLVAITAPCRSDETAESEMAKIEAAHKHWRESIVSVRFVWETVHDPHSQLAKDSGFDGVKRSSHTEFIWCDDGRVRLYEFGRHNDGPEILRSLRCADGKRYYSVHYGNGPSEIAKPDSVEIMPQPTPGQGGGLSLTPLIGLWNSGRLYWLADLLAQKAVAFDGSEDVADRTMPRIKIQMGLQVFCPIVLDPEKGYLPRVFDCGAARFEVLSYRRVDPDLWFPWTGSLTNSVDNSTWEMKEIQVNGVLDPILFQPPLAPGTVINDVISSKQTVHGSASNRVDVEERIANRAQDNLRFAGDPVAARSPDSGTVQWVIITSVGSLALLLIAVWLKRRG